jgi:hypothetical protein
MDKGWRKQSALRKYRPVAMQRFFARFALVKKV